MTKRHSTRKSLIASILILCLCFTSFVGTTFAWFTDEVTSSGNIIQSGTLKVGMYWAEGDEDPDTFKDWKNAKDGAIFNSTLWEPGRIEAKHLKIANEGTLALRYQMRIIANGVVSDLADVIDVYYFYDVDNATDLTGAVQLERADFDSAIKLGTLAEVLDVNNVNNIFKTVSGTLESKKETTMTIAFKMQESAGNEYQEKSIGTDFSIQLFATQYTFEKDSFDDQYDADANYITLADKSVVRLDADGSTTLISVADVNIEDGVYNVPLGVTTLGGWVIDNPDVKTVIFSDTVRDLEYQAFKGSPVEEVVINEGIEVISRYAFNSGKNIKKINIPSTVKRIDEFAFSQTAITEIVIPANVESIGFSAFTHCGSLETVVIEGDVEIEAYAFKGCDLLKNVFIYGDVDFVPSSINPSINSTWFCNKETNNPNYSDIDFHVTNDIVKEKVLTAMGAERNNTDVFVDIDVVSNSADLATAIANATDDTATILLSNGTYSDDINLTVAALGQAKCENLIFKATGDDVVIAGTVTIGYRQQNVGAASYEAKITFDGITFDHAESGKHCLNVQDVESFYMANCTVIGDGEYGISSPGSNGTGESKIENCKFINAGLQLAGKFAQNVVIDNCEFEESVINVQGGGPLGPTIQNSKFDITLKEAHNNGSFYVIRNSNAGANINVANCEINVDAEQCFTGVAGSKGWGVFVNRIASYDINAKNVTITMTDAALAQPALKVAACLSTGKIIMTDVTVNGVKQ